MPAIIRFLDYYPQRTAGARGCPTTTTLGFAQEESVKRLGVDACTLSLANAGKENLRANG